MSKVRSLKAGATADQRIIRTVADTDLPDAAPVAGDNGSRCFGASFLHVYVKFTGSVTAADITPWFRNPDVVDDDWFEGNQINFLTNSRLARIQLEGEQEVYFRVDAMVGVGTVQIWAGNSWATLTTTKDARG